MNYLRDNTGTIVAQSYSYSYSILLAKARTTAAKHFPLELSGAIIVSIPSTRPKQGRKKTPPVLELLPSNAGPSLKDAFACTSS